MVSHLPDLPPPAASVLTQGITPLPATNGAAVGRLNSPVAGKKTCFARQFDGHFKGP
jgi:hypothetical protein